MSKSAPLESQVKQLPRPSHALTVEKSPDSSTLNAKLDSLDVAKEFRFSDVDPLTGTGVNRPGRFDAEIASCIVHGEIPTSLDGTFYRVICDSQFANRTGKDMWINGDGAVDAWRFSNGVVDFKQKFVRTPRYIYERAARQPMAGQYRNPYGADPRFQDEFQTTANTHIYWWCGHLLVLKEDSPPMEIDPDTMETIGFYNFEGQLTSKTFTAHPKSDPDTGDLMCYGMEASGLGSNDLAYYRFNKEGQKLDECWVKTPHVSWTHDMVATDNYVAFVMNCYETDVEHVKKTLDPHFRYNCFLPTTFVLLPRRNPKPQDAEFFTTLPNHVTVHVCNHFDQGGYIYVDALVTDTDGLGGFPPKHPELKRPVEEPNGKLVRYKIDPRADSSELDLPVALNDIFSEMPRCDDRFLTKPYNHAYGAFFGRCGFDGIYHTNIETGLTKLWSAGNSVTVGEPCFVPRVPDAPEGDGYLLVACRDWVSKLASLVILDANDINQGPIGVVELPLILREGVHGIWLPTSDMQSRKPLVDYSGVTSDILDKVSTGAPKPFDELVGHPVKLRF